MTPWHPSLLASLAHRLGCGARAALLRAALISAVGVIGAAGCGFVVFAAFAALRMLVGPELAALGIGIALLALAGLLTRNVQGLEAEPVQIATPPQDAPSPPTDPATLLVFTAAFVLGRRLANRRQD